MGGIGLCLERKKEKNRETLFIFLPISPTILFHFICLFYFVLCVVVGSLAQISIGPYVYTYIAAALNCSAAHRNNRNLYTGAWLDGHFFLLFLL